jgi:hypothetical protein
MRKSTKATSLILALGLALAMSSALAKSAEPRYKVKGAEVYDHKTRLTWQRCSVGQQWVGTKKKCIGSVKLFKFDAAQKLAHAGWRMPTKDELATLVDLSKIIDKKKPPMIDEAAFPDMDLNQLVYWTSTADGPLFAWTVLFGESETYLYSGPRKQSLAVRLVRGKH